MDGIPCAHPLTSFDGHRQDWQGTPLAITGAVPGVILDAFQSLGFCSFELLPELKPLYHACAVMSSGHTAELWLGAQALLQEKGIMLPGRGLFPLAEATLRNIEKLGKAGQTGPFVRGDEMTIQRDVEALPEAWRDVFLKLGRS